MHMQQKYKNASLKIMVISYKKDNKYLIKMLNDKSEISNYMFVYQILNMY